MARSAPPRRRPSPAVNFQAAGALIAIYARGVNGGRGQYVDVSMQEAMTNAMDHASPTYDIRGVSGTGPGIYRGSSAQPGSTERRSAASIFFETSDGWLTALRVRRIVAHRQRHDRLARGER